MFQHWHTKNNFGIFINSRTGPSEDLENSLTKYLPKLIIPRRIPVTGFHRRVQFLYSSPPPYTNTENRLTRWILNYVFFVCFKNFLTNIKPIFTIFVMFYFSPTTWRLDDTLPSSTSLNELLFVFIHRDLFSITEFVFLVLESLSRGPSTWLNFCSLTVMHKTT